MKFTSQVLRIALLLASGIVLGAPTCTNDECAGDGDCDDEELCVDGECVECEDDTDCDAREVCEDGECERESANEGEGEGGEGEGEGEGGEGEGEGEGFEGEGEGFEGEGEGEDEAGPISNPVDVTLPFTSTISINTAGDADCFRFTVATGGGVTASSPSCGGGDPEVTLYDSIGSQVGYDDDGIGLCPSLTSSITAGTYTACYEDLGGTDTIFGMSISISFDPEITLGLGETCDPFSSSALCDSSLDLECLEVAPDTNACAVFEVLEEGETCIPDTNAAVCDDGLSLACIDPEADGTASCLNPEQEACNNVLDLAADPITFNIGAADLTNGSCSFSSTAETVLRYTVDSSSPLQNITFTGSSNTRGLFVRNTCELVNTERTCSSTLDGSVTVGLLPEGTDIFLFVEGDANDDVTIDVSSVAVIPLTEGETCSTSSTTSACGPTLSCISSVCRATTVLTGAFSASDPTWNRAGTGCGTPSGGSYALDIYDVINTGATATTLDVQTRAQGDATFNESCTPDPVLAIYRDGFDPLAQTTGCVAVDDDGGIGSVCSRLSGSLDVGETVQLIVTAYSAGALGPYEAVVVSPGTTITATLRGP